MTLEEEIKILLDGLCGTRELPSMYQFNRENCVHLFKMIIDRAVTEALQDELKRCADPSYGKLE